MSKLTKVTIFVTTVVVVVAAILLAGAAYMLDYSLNVSESRTHKYDYCKELVYAHYPELQQWHDSLWATQQLRDTFLVAADGLKRHAWVMEHPTDSLHAAKGASVVVHGYTDNAPIMMRYIYLHYEVLGRNVVVPELFGHGLSEGDHARFGWLDRLDMRDLWLPLTHSLWPDLPIVQHGLSMGGATTMMTSGETLPDSLRVAGFIDDCGYSSTWDQMAWQLQGQFSMPAFPLLYVTDWLCGVKNGWRFSQSSSIDQVAKSTKPMLFIHGGSDSYVPTWMGQACYDAKQTGYKELWIAPGSEHANSIHDHWEEYIDHVSAFLNRIEK